MDRVPGQIIDDVLAHTQRSKDRDDPFARILWEIVRYLTQNGDELVNVIKPRHGFGLIHDDFVFTHYSGIKFTLLWPAGSMIQSGRMNQLLEKRFALHDTLV